MKDQYMLAKSDYIVIEDSYFIFYDHLPDGPVKLLQSSDRIKVTYADYDNRIKCVSGGFDSEKIRLGYFAVPGDMEFWKLLHLISVFNDMTEDVKIFCTGEDINKLRDYCNSNIGLFDLDLLEKGFVIELDCVVASSPAAIYFMLQEVPVMIAGTCGLGGWVTPENFHYLSRNGFKGRPGGNQWEHIPPQAFADELRGIKYAADKPVTLSGVRTLAGDSMFTPQSRVDLLIEGIKKHLASIRSETERWHLVPSFASNIFFVNGQNKAYIKRLILNDTIAIVEDTDFFRYIDGKRSFAELFDIYDDQENSFWDFVHILIQQKIIVF